MNHVVAIVGPTGIGKTRLAIDLAREFNAEIVNADSRQVYRHMDIGTAKPTPTELTLVPHHLINIVNPDEEFSLAQYQEQAFKVIRNIQQRGSLPILVGGSGLYVKAILENWQIPRVSPDPQFRYNIEKKATEAGTEELYQELRQADPGAARKIDSRNLRRIIRALEVLAATGKPFSRFGRKKVAEFRSLIIGLTTDRTSLYNCVDGRVDAMFERGLVAEVEKLIGMGYDFNLPAMSGIGYRQVGQYLRGEVSLEAARQKIKTETHRFIRQQYAWFRLADENIHWFDTGNQEYSAIETAVKGFLNSA